MTASAKTPGAPYSDLLVARFGATGLALSALADEGLFRAHLDVVCESGPIRCAVETGTFKGWSAAVLADYADEVHTIDCHDHPGRAAALALLGIGNVSFHLTHSEAEKAGVIGELWRRACSPPDFAFIDGAHMPGVEIDFKLLRGCGRVLFHDYSPGFPAANLRTYVCRFVDSIERRFGGCIVSRRPPFALWYRDPPQ